MALLPAGADHFHLFPVVGKFFAAIQAHNVCSGQRGCLSTTATATSSYRKTITAMPATKDSFDQFAEHVTIPQESRSSRTSFEVWCYVPARSLTSKPA